MDQAEALLVSGTQQASGPMLTNALLASPFNLLGEDRIWSYASLCRLRTGAMVVAAWSCHRLSVGPSLFRLRSAAHSCLSPPLFVRKGMSRARSDGPRHAGHASGGALRLQPTEPQPTLEWLASKHGAAERLKLRRSYLGEQLGWGIIAAEDVEPGEVLLSVPLHVAITSEVGEC